MAGTREAAEVCFSFARMSGVSPQDRFEVFVDAMTTLTGEPGISCEEIRAALVLSNVRRPCVCGEIYLQSADI